jgi:hypothetical protein
VSETIDTTFDLGSDTPPKRDTDTFSPSLASYHKVLWSKPLPSGSPFDLDVSGPPFYLHHRSDLGEFWLSSDTVIHTYSSWPRVAHIISQIPPRETDEFRHLTYTIGGMMVFPANKVDGKMTMNGCRGFNHKIRDRFDLTLECIRLYYLREPSPLGECIDRYPAFFGLFDDFAGYVSFFLLQDLVDPVDSTVAFFTPFDGFNTSPVPRTLDEYLGYRERAMEFINARNRRIAALADAPTGARATATPPPGARS